MELEVVRREFVNLSSSFELSFERVPIVYSFHSRFLIV